MKSVVAINQTPGVAMQNNVLENYDEYVENYSYNKYAGRPDSSEVPRNPLTRWGVSSIPANGIFLTKKLKKLK